MVTKTKASTDRNPLELKEIIVNICHDDEVEILESAGFEINPNDLEQVKFIDALKFIVSRNVQGNAGINNLSLPSNVISELKAISDLSIELFDRLSPAKLSVQSQSILSGKKLEHHPFLAVLKHGAYELEREKLDKLCSLLFEISYTSKQATLEYEHIQKQSGNLHKKEHGGLKRKIRTHYETQLRAIIKESLEDLYKNHAPYFTDETLRSEREQDLNGFLNDFLEIYEERKNSWVTKKRINRA